MLAKRLQQLLERLRPTVLLQWRMSQGTALIQGLK